jgi:hypothetical protein
LSVLHAQNVHHIIILLFLFQIVDLNPQNITLIVIRVNAGVKLNIITVRVFVLCETIAVPLIFVILKRMVVVLLTLETIII